ncbi:hypothetical protein WJX81_002555 [Elliptochloris bilobata]|uniref:Mitotic checkpoint regulator, MAD2B-interacting-domain-containing protein n=1 Tax=Elliptochloris bilobata TaxID=381761 RepID=A0AAW1QY93_9CHLO
MEMLSGYGSDASSEGDRAVSPPQPAVQTVHTTMQERTEVPQNLFPTLPEPSVSGAALFASVPAPKQGAKQAVTFRLPRPRAPIDSDEEEERPKKKLRPSSKGKRLTDFLPPPSNDTALALGSGKRLDMDDDDDFSDDQAPVAAAAGPIADADFNPAAGDIGPYVAGPAPERLAGGSEAYRVALGSHRAVEQAPEWAMGGVAEYPAPRGPLQGPSADAGGTDGERMLAEALAAETSSAAKRSKDPFVDLGVKFVEVDQEELRRVDPAAREAMNAARTAFGADYEARLRAEAGAAPDKLSRRKHQISSLYHSAKMKELEMLDMRGQGLKTKAQTQAKYGW